MPVGVVIPVYGFSPYLAQTLDAVVGQDDPPADVVVVDPATVAAKPIEIRHDLPGGSWRLYGEAEGIDHVLVNGTEIVDHGRLTGARPGRVMRSGHDTAGTAIS